MENKDNSNNQLELPKREKLAKDLISNFFNLSLLFDPNVSKLDKSIQIGKVVISTLAVATSVGSNYKPSENKFRTILNVICTSSWGLYTVLDAYQSFGKKKDK